MTRPEMVENGLKFLRHPNVQATPLSERVSFLEQKGMTKDEIQAAIERYQSEPEVSAPPMAPVAAQAAAAVAPMVAAAAAPVQQLMRRRRMPTYLRVLLTISSVVGAATLLGFFWNYMVHAGYFPWFNNSRRMLEAAKNDEEEAEATANEKQSETALLSSLQDVSSAIQSQTQELTKLCTTIDAKEDELTRNRSANNQIRSTISEQATVQAIAELKAEVSTLKALLVAGASGVAATASATSALASGSSASTNAVEIPPRLPLTPSTSVPATAAPVPEKETSAQRMQTALKKFRQENTIEQLKLASGILIMYVKNLVENPDVPRYRRIAPANANFKQKIEPLKHHDELLKSIGFESTGLNMEWRWHLLDRSNGEFDEHLAILRALLKALQAVSKASSDDILALEEIAQQSLDKFYAERKEKEDAKEEETDSAGVSASATDATVTTSKTTVVEKTFTTATTSKADTDLQAFLSRLEQKTAKTLEEAKAAPVATSVGSTDAQIASIIGTGVIVHDDEEEKAPVPIAASTSEDAAPSGEPPYPKSFTEVMEMIKKGEPVPGIQQIEERISDDSAKFLTEEKSDAGAMGTAAVAVAAAPAKPWEKR